MVTVEKEVKPGWCPNCNNRYDEKWYRAKHKCSECGKPFLKLDTTETETEKKVAPSPALQSQTKCTSKYVPGPVGGNKKPARKEKKADTAATLEKEQKHDLKMDEQISEDVLREHQKKELVKETHSQKTAASEKKKSLFEDEDESENTDYEEEADMNEDEPDDLLYDEEDEEEDEETYDGDDEEEDFYEGDIEEDDEEEEEPEVYEDKKPQQNLKPSSYRKSGKTQIKERRNTLFADEDDEDDAEEETTEKADVQDRKDEEKPSPAQWLKKITDMKVMDRGEERLIDEKVFDSNLDGYYDNELSGELPTEDKIPKSTIIKAVGAIILLFGMVAFMIYYA